jgi:hypothetical protein
MFKYILIALGVIFFTGCETKLKNVLKQDPQYVQTLQNTQRGNIVNSFETKAIIVATYLKDDENGTHFLIGVYNDDEEIGIQEGGLFNKNYSLTLNELNSSKISVIDEKKLKELGIKNYPFYQKWMKYYNVDFPKSKKPYNIEYKNNLYGAVKLIFK